PVDPKFRVVGRFTPYVQPVPIEMDFEGASDGHVVQAYASRGIITFALAGAPQRLEAFDEQGARLYLLFRDVTTGVETYPSGRFLYAPLPDEGGSVDLDFNRTLIPGCAFTLHATCPVPPRQNKLSVAVRAGEREYLATP